MVTVGRKMMKERILLVSSGGLDNSGVPAVLMTIVRGLADKYSFDILLNTMTAGYYEQQFTDLGGKVFRCPRKHFRFKPFDRLAELVRPVHMFFFTRNLLRKNGPYKAIHCCNDFDASGCVAAAEKAGVPIRICHTHKSWKPDSAMGLLTRMYRSECRKAILKHATVLAGCSAQADSTSFGPSADAIVICNPYDKDRFTPSLPLNNPLSLELVQIGYFSRNKNQLFSVEVLEEIRKTRPDAHLVLIGHSSGSYWDKVRHAVEEKNLADSVTFLPADTDIPAAMERSSVLLLPSESEGFGIVLIEAQAMGLHCVASDTVPRETDRGGVVYLPVKNPQTWAAAILADRHISEKTIRDCSCFSKKAFIETVEEIYTEKHTTLSQ